MKKLGKTEEAQAAIGQLVELGGSDPESLAELLEWLVGKRPGKRWTIWHSCTRPQFASEPGFLYLLAGRTPGRDRTNGPRRRPTGPFACTRARTGSQLAQHLRVARLSPPPRPIRLGPTGVRTRHRPRRAGRQRQPRLEAQSALAEMLHDQGQDLEAAKVLEPLVAAIDAGKVTENDCVRKPSEIRSRMDYFFACHWQAKGDAARATRVSRQGAEGRARATSTC